MKRKNSGKYIIWCIGMTSFILLYWIFAHWTDGTSLLQYIFHNVDDSFEDFFSMMSIADDRNIYEQGISYPPLAMVIFKLLNNFVPREILNAGPRVMQSKIFALFVYMVFCIVCLLSMGLMITDKLQVKKWEKVSCLYLVMLSGPMLYLLQRGNILLLALVLTMFYCFYYDSESKVVRELAYLSLAIAAGIKIYPAIFGLLLVQDKKYKETIRLIIYGIVFFTVPFLHYGGFREMITMFQALGGANFTAHGFGYNVSFDNFIRLSYHLLGHDMEHISVWWNLIPIVVSFFIFLFAGAKWKRNLGLTLLLIWLPSFSYTYVLTFLLIPLILFFNEEKRKLDWYYSLLLVILLAPASFGIYERANWINAEIWYPVTNYMYAINIVLLVLGFSLVIEVLVRYIKLWWSKCKKGGEVASYPDV